jgi:hypothetical protein
VNAAENNYLADHEKAKLEAARRSCAQGKQTACKEAARLEALDKKRDDIQLAGILNQPGLGNVYPESLLLGGAVIKGTGQALGVLGNSAFGNSVLGALGNAVLKLTPEAVVIGGGISGGVNAGAQYLINDGKVDWGNVGITAGVGALTYGAGLLYTVGANGAAGGYMNYRQGSSVVEGVLIGGVTAGIGWGVGTVITNGFNPIFNPIRNSYTFYPPAAGSYFLQTPAVNYTPALLGTAVGSTATENSSYILNKPSSKPLKK